MDHQSVFDIMKMGFEYILVTIFILASIKCIEVRNHYADVINQQYDTRVQTQNRLEFSKYNTGLDQRDASQCVSADVLMEAIRLYKDGSITIYVDKLKYGTDLLLTKETAVTMADRFSVASLVTELDFTTYYHPYLVYDSGDMEGPYVDQGTEVTGIAFIQYTGG